MKELHRSASEVLTDPIIRYSPIKQYTNFVERLSRKYGIGAVAMNVDKKTGQIIHTISTPKLSPKGAAGNTSDNNNNRSSNKQKRNLKILDRQNVEGSSSEAVDKVG